MPKTLEKSKDLAGVWIRLGDRNRLQNLRLDPKYFRRREVFENTAQLRITPKYNVVWKRYQSHPNLWQSIGKVGVDYEQHQTAYHANVDDVIKNLEESLKEQFKYWIQGERLANQLNGLDDQPNYVGNALERCLNNVKTHIVDVAMSLSTGD